jgi:gluconokinase
MFTGAAVIMGVTSCGKTTVGEAVAAELGVSFTEGDRLHSPESIVKMSQGIPLTDEDRWPWLGRVGASLAGHDGRIASCSALKKAYRRAIAEQAGRAVSFILLHGDRQLLAARIAARKNHFMPPSLLDSQLATLEVPGDDELSITIDIALPVSWQAAKAKAFLLGRVG